jgi:hypothetical protein
MAISINHRSYLIESQIANDRLMGVRILQYIFNQTRYTTTTKNHITRVRVPNARVIYWETTPSTPDTETIIFQFPNGAHQSLEVPSFKFPGYSPAQLEAMNMGVLLPFCMVKPRKELKKLRTAGERERWKLGLKDLVREVVQAAARSEGRGILSRGDLLNVLGLTRHLQHELYGTYTEETEEREMWEDIDIIDYDGMLREAEEQFEERLTEKVEKKVEKKFKEQFEERTAREKEQAVRLAEEHAARKLRELGVSDEQLAAAGLLEAAN